MIYNALQAMNHQGHLEIKMEERDRHVVVSITDSGSGIPKEIQDKIFEPFFTTKGAGEGSGLGLDIVNKIVQNHQGRIELESQPGRTTFSIWLSMDLSPEPKTNSPSFAENYSPSAPSSPQLNSSQFTSPKLTSPKLTSPEPDSAVQPV